MAKVVSLSDAMAELVHDGDTVALEGFTHLIPVAAGQEIIRQGRKDLTLVRMTPDIVYDQLIGAGCARKLIFSWGGNPGVSSLHRFRDAVQYSWPVPLEIEEHSHTGMANRYVAGASGLPFAVLRGYTGTDLAAQTETIKPITCPFTGEVLTAVPALNPDVTIVHAQRGPGWQCSALGHRGCPEGGRAGGSAVVGDRRGAGTPAGSGGAARLCGHRGRRSPRWRFAVLRGGVLRAGQ